MRRRPRGVLRKNTPLALRLKKQLPIAFGIHHIRTAAQHAHSGNALVKRPHHGRAIDAFGQAGHHQRTSVRQSGTHTLRHLQAVNRGLPGTDHTYGGQRIHFRQRSLIIEKQWRVVDSPEPPGIPVILHGKHMDIQPGAVLQNLFSVLQLPALQGFQRLPGHAGNLPQLLFGGKIHILRIRKLPHQGALDPIGHIGPVCKPQPIQQHFSSSYTFPICHITVAAAMAAFSDSQ